MNVKSRIVCAASALLLVGTVVPGARAQFGPLVQRVPESANTIFLLNADKVLDSEVAKREGWRTNFAKAIESGLIHLPADTEQFVLASEMDFGTMQPVWQVAAVKTTKQRDLAAVAKTLGAKRDTVSSHPAIIVPAGHYVVQCAPTSFASLVPAARQAVVRWITGTDDASPQFSDYITEAIGYSEQAGTELILAADLQDVLDAERVQERLAGASFGADVKIDAEQLTEVLVSLRGAMLGVTLGEKPYGSIKIDFGRDASALEGIAKHIMLDALAHNGVMIDDLADWDEKVTGNQVTFSGYLTSPGLRKILSLLDSPLSTAVAAEEEAAVESASDQDPVAVASQKYFQSIEHYFQDLRSREPQRIAQYGTWFDKYARKIDQLPMVNVDDDMLTYGAYVSQQLRNAAAAIQGIGIRSRVRQVDAAQASGGATPGYYGNAYNGGYAYGGNYYHGGFGGGGNYMQEGLQQQQMARTSVKVQEKAAGTTAARAIIRDIENASLTVRREMTKKYNVEF